MKKHFKTFLPQLLIATSFLLIASCKQDHSIKPEENDFTISKAKSWYFQTYASVQNDFPSSESDGQTVNVGAINLSRLMKFINWDSYSIHKTNGKTYILIDIDERMIRFDKGLYASRKFVFSKSSSDKMQMNIVEYVNKTKVNNKPESFKHFITNYFHSENIEITGEDGVFVIYDMNYRRLGSRKLNKGKFYNSTTGIRKDKPQQVSAESSTSENDCTLWGYFLVTYDQFGNILEQELLYTYLVCPNGNPDEEEMPSDYGGGNTPVPLPTRQKDWIVQKAQSGSWMVSSTEQFTGVNDPISGIQFTGIAHLGDNGYALSNHVNISWTRQGVTTTLESPVVASSKISGKVTVTISNDFTGNVDPAELLIDVPITNQKLFSVSGIW